MNFSAELAVVLITIVPAIFMIYVLIKGEWRSKKPTETTELAPPYRNGEIITHEGKRHVILASFDSKRENLKHTIHLCAPIDNTECVDYIPVIGLIENACHEWTTEVNKINRE